MNKIISFIDANLLKILVSAALICLGIHWGLMGFLPICLVVGWWTK